MDPRTPCRPQPAAPVDAVRRSDPYPGHGRTVISTVTTTAGRAGCLRAAGEWTGPALLVPCALLGQVALGVVRAALLEHGRQALGHDRRSLFSAQTSRLNSAIRRIGEVATTEAVRRPPSATSGAANRSGDEANTAISPTTSPVAMVRTVAPSMTTSAVPLSTANSEWADPSLRGEGLP